MTVPPLDVELQSRTSVRVLVELGLVVAGYVAAWALGVIPDWLGVVGVVLFGGLVLVGVLTGRRPSGPRPAARLDEVGVTVPGAPVVPWSALREVVVGPMHPVWLVGSRRTQVVSFLPRSGAELPGPPQASGRPQRWGRWWRLRLYGTNLVLLSSATTVGGEQIAAAARDLGGLPVRHERPRGARTLVVVAGVAVLAGVAVALVRHLVG